MFNIIFLIIFFRSNQKDTLTDSRLIFYFQEMCHKIPLKIYINLILCI